MTPVILLAFANDKRDSGSGYLRGLTAERNAIRDALMKAEENGLCQVLIEPDATIERLFDIFQNSAYRDRISIFHYGGHAESYSLLLETATGEQSTAHSEGLVSFLAKQKSLKLVFLNGCSSQKQSEDLIDAGLPAVIGTSQVINDGIATNLASRFYKGLSQGLAIEPSWTDAVDQVKTETGTENTAKLFSGSLLKKPGKDQFPWNLYFGEGGAISKAWNLPEAANQPLFGLELPKYYFRKLPLNPYVGIRSFKLEEAAIFHGRGTDIRKLYTQLQREQPVVLLSGKKGVGKSSMLAAGLAPRLEADGVVSMSTIEGRTSNDALSEALDSAREANSLKKLAPKDKSNLKEKISEIEAQLPSVSGFAKDILTYELERLIRQAALEQMSFYEQWMAIESETQKPLTIILDELPDDPNEWQFMLEAMMSIFEVENSPQGKLVLSVDEQHHSAFSELLQTADFPATDIFLQPLTRDDVQDAMLGVTTSPLTKEFYRLEIEDNNINSLPNTLTGDLLEGDTTLVAPYLQVILSSLWNDAVKVDAQHPSISVSAYQQGILSGELMDTFLSSQLDEIEAWKEDIVQSGLALDLLSLHTSAMGNSKILEAPKRDDIYGDRSVVVSDLAKKCCTLFLLTNAHSEATNLGHNMLAPSLIRNYSNSLFPGQQASRILNGKMSEVTESDSKVWLNETELAVVEAGIQGMRQLSEEEEELLAFSREKKIQAEKERKRNKIIRTVLGTIVIIFAGIAAYGYYISNQNYMKSRAGELASLAKELLPDDNTMALRLAVSAYNILGEKSPPLVKETLTKIFFTQEERPFYSSNFPHKERVYTAVFSPIDDKILTASEDGFVILWNAAGKELNRFDHVIEVKEAAFSPNGKQILSRTLSHVYLWDLDGVEPIDKDSLLAYDDVLSKFSTDGMKITPRFEAVLDSLTLATIDTLKAKSYVTVKISPDKNLIMEYGPYVPFSLYDNTGAVLLDSFLMNVEEASFSKDGKNILTVAQQPINYDSDTPEGYKSIVTLWTTTGDSVLSFKCKGQYVNAVLSEDGKKILTASSDFTAKLWDFSNPFLHRFPKQAAAVKTVDYDKAGKRYVTAGVDSTARIWNEFGEMIDSIHHHDQLNSAYFSPGGNHILTASEDGTARLWSPKEDIRWKELRHFGEVKSAVFSHNGKYVLTAAEDSTVCLWDLKGELIYTHHLTDEVEEAIFSPDDKFILARTKDYAATLLEVKGYCVQLFHHPERIFSISFSNDGKSILTSCGDNLVRMWSTKGTLEGDFVQSVLEDEFIHYEKPKQAIFTKDGKYLLTGGNMIYIWKRNGQLIDSLPHVNGVTSLNISPDKSLILTTSYDKNAYIWNFEGKKLATYQGHKGSINMGYFTPDSKHILTTSSDGEILRWSTPQAIYKELQTRNFYEFTRKQLEEFEIVK